MRELTKLRGFMVIVLAAALATLAGCNAMVSSYVKVKENIQSKAFDYPESPKLSPIASAVYTTIVASRDDFASYKDGPLPASEKREYIEFLETSMQLAGNQRGHIISAMQVIRQANYSDANLKSAFKGTGYDVISAMVIEDHSLQAGLNKTELYYTLSTNSRDEAKRLAAKLAAELEKGPLSESAGWDWKTGQENKEEMLKNLRNSAKNSKGTSLEKQTKQTQRDYEVQFEKADKAGFFDNFISIYQWYPNRIDNKEVRLSSVGFTYTDKHLKVNISRLAPESGRSASAPKPGHVAPASVLLAETE